MDHMMSEGAGYFMGIFMFIWLALIVWFFIFSVIVLVKLNKISRQLEKK